MHGIEESRGGLLKINAQLNELLGDPEMRVAVVGAIEELVDYARADVSDNVLDAESEALMRSRRILRKLFELKLQRELDRHDAAISRCPIRCAKCEGVMPSQGRRERRWSSCLGELRLRRRYSYCAVCKHGRAPSQDVLGLGASEFTPHLEEVCTLMSTTVPFDMARDLVHQVCGAELSTKGVQEISDRRGTEVLKRLHTEADIHQPFDDSGLPREPAERPSGTCDEGAAPRRAYVEIDGVIPMTRVEIDASKLSDIDRARQARAKTNKVRGGKGKRFTIVGREVKNAVLYSGEACAQTSIGRGCLIDKRYVSHLGGWEEFARRVWAEVRRLRFDEASELVIISDGAEWIRSVAKWLPVKCILILDLFHVKHRIWEAAHALFGQNAKASAWAKRQCARVEDGRAAGVIETLEQTTTERAEPREIVRLLVHYLRSNKDRMNYPVYRAAGLRVGSGAVESANFHVTGARLKLQGMRWSADGATQMAALRADLFNGRHFERSRQLLAA